MNATHTTGLGDPEPLGKKRLFQPPVDDDGRKITPIRKKRGVYQTGKRLRTSIDLTQSAITIIQSIQAQHRLRTGKVLPLWKLVSQAIEYYGKSEEGIQA